MMKRIYILKIFLMVVILFSLLSCNSTDKPFKQVFLKDVPNIDELDQAILSDINFDYRDIGLSEKELSLLEKYQYGEEELYFGIIPWDFSFHSSTFKEEEYYVGYLWYVTKQLEQVFDLEIQIIEYDDVSEMFDDVENGRVIAPGIFYTEERSERFYYSEAYTKDPMYIYYLPESNIENAFSFDGLIGGRIADSAYFETEAEILNESGIRVQTIEYNPDTDLGHLLENGDIDFISDAYSVEYIKRGYQYRRLEDYSIAEIYDNIHLIGQKGNDEVTMIFDIFEKAFDMGLSYNINEYQDTYVLALAKNGDYFSEEEKSLIIDTKSKPLLINSDANFKPFTFYNFEEDTWDGYAYSLFNSIAVAADFDYEIDNEIEESWAELLNDMGRDGNTITVDGIIGVGVTESRKEYISYSVPIARDSITVVGLIEDKQIRNFNEMIGYKVGVIHGYGYLDQIDNYTSGMTYIFYEDNDALIQALKDGEIDYYITYESQFMNSFFTEKEYDIRIKYTSPDYLLLANGFSRTTDGNDLLLVSITNKLIPIVDVDEIESVYLHSADDVGDVIKSNKLERTLTILGVLISVSLIVTFTIYHLKYRRLSRYDTLTGLKNHNALMEYMRKKSFSNFDVIYLDLDGFKEINDFYGHSIGDKMLIKLASRVKNITNVVELFRVGGDEFLFFTSNCKDSSVAKKLYMEASRPFMIEGYDLKINPSMGVVQSTHFNQLTMDELIVLADYCMVTSRETLTHEIVYLSNEIYEEFKKEQEYSNKIGLAILQDEFVPYYQPFYDLHTGKIVGFEALARWKRNDEMIYPDSFLKIAIKKAVIKDLDFSIMEQSMYFYKKLKKLQLIDDSYYFSCNLSTHTISLMENDDIETLFVKHALDTKTMFFEVTEHNLIIESASNRINELTSKGVKFAIDDFSAGHSSLVYIMNMKFGTLKLDKKLVDKLITDRAKSDIILSNILSIAKELNISVIAEGIEQKEQIEILKKHDVNIGQGYYLSHPLSEEDFIHLLKLEKTSD